MIKRLLLALSVWLATSQVAFAQCAMCKTLLTNSPEGRAISGRFNIAILVMLVAPYAVAAGVFLVAFREHLLRWFAGGGKVVDSRQA